MYYVNLKFDDFDFDFFSRNNFPNTLTLIDLFVSKFQEAGYILDDVNITHSESDLLYINDISQEVDIDFLVRCNVSKFLSFIDDDALF